MSEHKYINDVVNVETEFKFNLSNGIMSAIRNAYGLLGDADGYKYSHSPQYPKGATRMMSYVESRGGVYDSVMMAGAQLLVLEYFTQRVTMAQIENIKAFCEEYGAPFDEKAWIKVVECYDGRPPVIIKAVPEGMIVPVKNVLLTIETSVADPDIFNIVSFFETKILRMWSPTTVATISYEARQIILAALNISCDDPEANIDTMLNDFGSRGVTSYESSCFSGVGHLFNFTGSDNVGSILTANIAYQATKCTGITLPASEHSTDSSWGRENELAMKKNMLDMYGAGFILASVSDTYDIENACKNIWGKELRQQVIDQNALVVIRPDSNDPVLMPIKCIEWLDESFGHTINKKGYKVLNHVRVIQGDGIEGDRIGEICNLLIRKGYSVENIAFGMGAGLLQKNDRDTQKFAMKCCAIEIDGVWNDVYKDPVKAELYLDEDLTIRYVPDAVKGASFKKSKAGRQTLIRNKITGDFRTVRVDDEAHLFLTNIFKPEDGTEWEEMLIPIYQDGDVLKVYTMDEVWAEARSKEHYIKAA
jgi:nicotinamide phosphoribosyltransferase